MWLFRRQGIGGPCITNPTYTHIDVEFKAIEIFPPFIEVRQKFLPFPLIISWLPVVGIEQIHLGHLQAPVGSDADSGAHGADGVAVGAVLDGQLRLGLALLPERSLDLGKPHGIALFVFDRDIKIR